MSRMFGERVFEFVLSIDLMDHDTFIDLLNLIYIYVNEHLDITYFSVLDETIVNNQPGLRTLWSTREETPSYTVDKDNGYASNSGYTFGENKPMWVVSASRHELQVASDLKNLWSDMVEKLPPYSTQSQEDIYTSIMHPLRKEGRPIGVFEFASKRYIEPTPASLEEIKLLAIVISRAYQMYDVHRTQRDSTKRALQMLEKSLKTDGWMNLALPQIFVAYPGTEYQETETEAEAEHKAVINTIRNVVDKFKDIITPIFWEDVTDTGNINEQVIRDISNSAFGLCYFSEPIAGGKFRDNANVLFEAGMMQALSNSPNSLLKAWIPIRERESAENSF